jgi:hypothetical protein
MFALHETTRRRLCRAGFVLLCVVPTLLVVGCAIWLRRAEYRELVARGLSQRLGFAVSLASVRHPYPDVTLFEGLELADPETGKRLARVRLVEVDASGSVLTLVASQPEIDAGDWSPWWDLLARELRHSRGLGAHFRIACGELTLHMPPGDQTFTEVRCQVESTEQGSEAACSFRLAGYEMSEPATLRVLRNRQTTPAMAGLEFQTGGATLAGGLLAAAWPPAAKLGAHCRFRGSLKARETANGWDGELAGQLLGVDLSELVSAQFPHKLSGRGELLVEQLRFHGGRIEQATGTLTAGPGLIGRSLLKSAGESLGLMPAGEIKTLGQSVPYEQLAWAFAVDEHGLSIRGQCGEPAPGAMLRDRSGALMLEPPRASQPVANLVRMLVPYNEVQVPFARGVNDLLDFLPAPPAHAVDASDGSPALPQARQPRLRRATSAQ